jgi:hypothetical protein
MDFAEILDGWRRSRLEHRLGLPMSSEAFAATFDQQLGTG